MKFSKVTTNFLTCSTKLKTGNVQVCLTIPPHIVFVTGVLKKILKTFYLHTLKRAICKANNKLTFSHRKIATQQNLNQIEKQTRALK